MQVWIEHNEPAPRRLLHPEPVGCTAAYEFATLVAPDTARFISTVTGTDMTDTVLRVIGHLPLDTTPEPVLILEGSL